MHINESTNIKAFLDWIAAAQAANERAAEDLKETDESTQDILHYLELNDAPYVERKALTDLLPEIRRKRRAAKDTADVLTPVMTWLKENKKAVHELQNALGAVRKREQAQLNRAYYYRTDVVKNTIGHE